MQISGDEDQSIMTTTKNLVKEEQKPELPLRDKEAATGLDEPEVVFVLYKAGVGSVVMASGGSYEAMWKDAEAKTGMTRLDLLKQNFTFDVVGWKEARKLIG